MEVAEYESKTHTTGYQCPQTQVLKPVYVIDYGLASKTIHEPQSNVARHPGIPVSITNHPDPLLFIPLLSNYRSGTEVLARGLIGTCAQINNHDRGNIGVAVDCGIVLLGDGSKLIVMESSGG